MHVELHIPVEIRADYYRILNELGDNPIASLDRVIADVKPGEEKRVVEDSPKNRGHRT